MQLAWMSSAANVFLLTDWSVPVLLLQAFDYRRSRDSLPVAAAGGGGGAAAATTTAEPEPQPYGDGPAPVATASTGPATQATAAISREFLLMVAPNKHVPHGRKLRISSCADMPTLLSSIAEQLQLKSSVAITPVANATGELPDPYREFERVPAKGKVQVWPADTYRHQQ
jgi:hypothetical protein